MVFRGGYRLFGGGYRCLEANPDELPVCCMC